MTDCPESLYGHVVVDDDIYECNRCGADRCPACLDWFADYDTFLDHLDSEEGTPP